MIVIALTGYPGSGKDSAFGAIKQLYTGARRYSFADKLKEEVARGWGCTVSHIEENKEAFRPLLQSWGEERRKFTPSYWVDRVDAKIKKENPSVAVITDMRHPFELPWLASKEGYLIRITRPGITPNVGHSIETALDSYSSDFDIVNDGTEEDLLAKVKAITDKIPNLGTSTAEFKERMLVSQMKIYARNQAHKKAQLKKDSL